MALSVRRLSREMVRPYEPNTPTAPLNLSVIDRMPMLRFDVRTLLVFKDGHETSAKSVREALSKALVPYYPLAGRLQESSDDGLHISCTGGVWFVEAFADCTLDAVSYLDKATLVTQENLLPDSIPEDDDQTKGLDPILQMQVTNFKCGGFVLGLIFSHSVCDATGISQFLNAVGEFARGLESPSVNPVWFREIIPSPSLVKEAPLMLPTPPLMPHYQLKQASFDVDAHKLDQLKRQLSNSIGKTCSTFEVLTAGIWRSRTRAINLNKSSINVKLVFYANISHLLNPPPQRGFYGNSIFPVTISVSSGWLVEASLAEIVQIIKEAKAKLPTEFNKWIDGKGGGDDPFVVPLDYTTLSISDWTKLGLKDVDLGWGCPVHVVPVEIPVEIMTIQPFGFPCLPPKPRTGIRFMTWCVEESHLPSFLDQMMNPLIFFNLNAAMTFSVTRLSRAIVQPSEYTPSGQLKLSVIDRLPSLRCYARTLHVFRDGQEASAEVIREALSKALVPYYPLAGRLQESSEAELHISCTGEGVWFVVATTSCTLESLNYFDDAPSVPHDDLLPDSIPETESLDPLVLMQVTSFKCGGYVIGLTFCHSICDGLGAAQFLNAVGEYARGFAHPSIEPIWFREALPSPVREPKLPPPPIMPKYQLKHASIDIPAQKIDQLKQEFFHLTGKTCSTFEVVAAAMWHSRTRAINFSKSSIVKLVFFANTRHLLNPPAPQGFYGNCFFPVTVTVSSGWLVEASHAEVVKIIKEAKARLPTEFNKWIYKEVDDGEEPFAPPLSYTTLFISEWGRLGFNEVDYGSGRPLYVMPIQGSSIIPVGIVCLPPRPKTGIRLMTWCVEGSHLPFLLDQMMSLA